MEPTPLKKLLSVLASLESLLGTAYIIGAYFQRLLMVSNTLAIQEEISGQY